MEAAARGVGVRPGPTIEIRKAEDLDTAFALAVKERAAGVLVLASPFFSSQSQRIVTLAAKARLPAIYEHRGFVEAGGLMSYGPDHQAIFRLVAEYVDKILRGAPPAIFQLNSPAALNSSSTSKVPRPSA